MYFRCYICKTCLYRFHAIERERDELKNEVQRLKDALHDAEAIGDFAEELRDRLVLKETAACVPILQKENDTLHAQLADLQEALDGEYGVLFWLERLHPMNPDEPCAVYTAWKKAKAMCPIRSTPTHRPTVYMIGEEGDTMETNNPNVVARFKEFGYKEYNKQEYKEQIRQQEHQGAKEAVREQRG